jgi:hypothetical protein
MMRHGRLFSGAILLVGLVAAYGLLRDSGI